MRKVIWLSVSVLAVSGASAQSQWMNYGGSGQHRANAQVWTQPYQGIRWSTPVDLNPQYSGTSLLIHYGSPLATRNNTIVITVKTGSSGNFEMQGRKGTDGSLLWTMPTDYLLPFAGWVPSCGSALFYKGPATALFTPAAGGTVLVRDSADSRVSPVRRLAFYGMDRYNADSATYNQNVKINTPITSDKKGNIYFGFQIYGATSAELVSGLAKITPSGAGKWVSAAVASGDPAAGKVATNCAPALSSSEDTVYFAVNGGSLGQTGYLVGVKTADLSFRYSRRLLDPRTGFPGLIFDDGTASPTIGLDGDVFYGILENPFASHHDRGWLLHFDSSLRTQKIPGSFGWDDTASVVPSSCVPQYAGNSKYLLLTKYNNYAGIGGNGVNQLAVLDPQKAQADFVFPEVAVMREVLAINAPTPDPGWVNNGYPNAVREWCINTAAIDVNRKCAHVNCEDGTLYKWDFETNTLVSSMLLAPPTGEAYTPTIIGPDGTIYAINNAILNAVGFD